MIDSSLKTTHCKSSRADILLVFVVYGSRSRVGARVNLSTRCFAWFFYVGYVLLLHNPARRVAAAGWDLHR